jgi:hypothetical protein
MEQEGLTTKDLLPIFKIARPRLRGHGQEAAVNSGEVEPFGVGTRHASKRRRRRLPMYDMPRSVIIALSVSCFPSLVSGCGVSHRTF